MVIIIRSNLFTLDQTLAAARVFHQHLIVVIMVMVPSRLLPCSSMPLPATAVNAVNEVLMMVVMVTDGLCAGNRFAALLARIPSRVVILTSQQRWTCYTSGTSSNCNLHFMQSLGRPSLRNTCLLGSRICMALWSNVSL